LRPIAAACNFHFHFSTPKYHVILLLFTSSLLNAHAHEDDIAQAVAALDPALSTTLASPTADINCLLADSSTLGVQFPAPPIDRAGRRIYYPLDYASVLSAAALRVTSGSSVLDVCAAPGGKSIAISQSLKCGGFLVCNEPDGDRRRRLTASLKDHCRFRRISIVEYCCYRPLFPAIRNCIFQL
jgi:putative hemolysin